MLPIRLDGQIALDPFDHLGRILFFGPECSQSETPATSPHDGGVSISPQTSLPSMPPGEMNLKTSSTFSFIVGPEGKHGKARHRPWLNIKVPNHDLRKAVNASCGAQKIGPAQH